jgi:hypothetical protein
MRAFVREMGRETGGSATDLREMLFEFMEWHSRALEDVRR